MYNRRLKYGLYQKYRVRFSLQTACSYLTPVSQRRISSCHYFVCKNLKYSWKSNISMSSLARISLHDYNLCSHEKLSLTAALLATPDKYQPPTTTAFT